MNTKARARLAVETSLHSDLPHGIGMERRPLCAAILGLVLALWVLLVPSAHAAGGDVDPTFVADPNGEVKAVAVQSDGKVLIGGKFTRVNHSVSSVVRNRITRLHTDGSVDTTFMNNLAGADNMIYAVVAQSDGRVLIGGFFQYVNDIQRFGIARLNADGSLDASFIPKFSLAGWTVHSIVVQSDGKVLIGGEFREIDGVTRNGIARLNADGTLDTSFSGVTLTGSEDIPGDWSVWATAVQPDGKVLIAGWFTRVNGVARTSIARLNTDGTLDTTFSNVTLGGNYPTYMPVFSVAIQSDSKVLIGGTFTQVNSVARSGLARLNANGTLDTSFMNGLTGTGTGWPVRAIAVQPDGKVLIGGEFTKVNGVTRNSIARLNADGSLDTNFMNGLSGVTAAAGQTPYVLAIQLQLDGKALIGGGFNYVNGEPRSCSARLLSSSSNADLSNLVLSSGTLAPPFAAGTTTYNANVINSITSVTVTPTASDTGATIRVNGTTVVSGSASGAINLNVGANTINVIVTAGDGTTTKTYTLTVMRDAIKTYLPLVIR